MPSASILSRLTLIAVASAPFALGAPGAQTVTIETSDGFLSSITFTEVSVTAATNYSNSYGLQIVIADTYGMVGYFGLVELTGDFGFSVNGGTPATIFNSSVRGQDIDENTYADTFLWGNYTAFSFVTGDTLTFSGTLTANALSLPAPVANGTYSIYLRNVELGATLTDPATVTVISGSAVPEPSAFAAMAGVAALGFVAARRRRS